MDDLAKNWVKVTEKYQKDGSALIDHVKFLEITISTHTETGQAEEEITVPLQRNYTGTKPVISSSLADTPCTTLPLLGLLERLNTTLRNITHLGHPGSLLPP
ncbi:hypothetical protein EV421DRAFT_1910363 [Armillaria borealis]|uniref:Uncharacterized protein n=1 Tax=Armillaria borealis TaxID=47425 RepID=A0AA39IYX8_9AGAR|nr:hypothetical protein EV421DRAFT_1910363 [Armillaria borealis]